MRPHVPVQAGFAAVLGLLAFAIIRNHGEEVRAAIATTSDLSPSEEVRRAAPMEAAAQSPAAVVLNEAPHYGLRHVAPGESLEDFAAQTSIDPAILSSLNRLGRTWPPHRPLVFPSAENAPAQKNDPLVIERGPVTQRVALTLDAGSEAGPVPRMLQTLRERRIQITFFVTGDFIATYPDIVRQIAADGHEFGNHSLTHPDFRKLGDARIRHELEATEDILKLTTGKTTRPYFRPPYGEYDDRVVRLAQESGYLTVCWSLDSLDSVGVTKSPRFLVERITARLGPSAMQGAIVLMHCDSEGTATALPVILDRFRQMNLEVVTLTRLLNAE